MDAAFDNVDSLMGASTTSKSGTALYSAALPVCRQMAAEVCEQSDISLAEGGYQALIEQDCNTVAKTYQTQTAQARAKVQEGSALLDISRLDIYQKRNSDDILTCKKKMLDMLTDSTVCGDELGKCLDITGQYINPTTGEVFLKPDLVNLTTLLSRPDDNATWSTTAKNGTFVTFLNSKKKFLQPAMEHCENIADAVWDSFIEDALAQIKLAQDKKLDDVRQSCTTLTGQCLSDAATTLTNFDARALSTFGIAADKTANTMCSDIINSCTALLKTTNDGGSMGDDSSASFGDLWNAGVSEITRKATYESLMQTCREVGRACIIQVCTSTSGNFGLCENIATSINRKSIINHTACWNEVKECIRSAGSQPITDIFTKSLDPDDSFGMDINFYADMYGEGFNIIKSLEDDTTQININDCKVYTESGSAVESSCVYDMCADDCANENSDLFTCRTCSLAEHIWGNCELPPRTDLATETSHNMIKTPTSDSTLLYWFAVNTGTESALDSCRDTTCNVGYVYDTNTQTCISSTQMCFTTYNDKDKSYCPVNQISTGSSCQCCQDNQKDDAGNCCENAVISSAHGKFCASSSDNSIVLTAPYYDATNPDMRHVLICDGGTMDNDSATCSGTLIDVQITTESGRNVFHYHAPTSLDDEGHENDGDGNAYVQEFFMTPDKKTCLYQQTGSVDNATWEWRQTDQNQNTCETPTHWSVVFKTTGQ